MSVLKNRFRSEAIRALLTVAALASFIYALGAGRKW